MSINKDKIIMIPLKECIRLYSILQRDLDRDPDAKRFDNEEINKLINHLDGLFVRWIRIFFRPLGIDVIHEPEESKPIRFVMTPLFQRNNLPVKDLGRFRISEEFYGLFLEGKKKDIPYYFLKVRFTDLEKSSSVPINLPRGEKLQSLLTIQSLLEDIKKEDRKLHKELEAFLPQEAEGLPYSNYSALLQANLNILNRISLSHLTTLRDFKQSEVFKRYFKKPSKK